MSQVPGLGHVTSYLHSTLFHSRQTLSFSVTLLVPLVYLRNIIFWEVRSRVFTTTNKELKTWYGATRLTHSLLAQTQTNYTTHTSALKHT
jgi:hypothetical protein